MIYVSPRTWRELREVAPIYGLSATSISSLILRNWVVTKTRLELIPEWREAKEVPKLMTGTSPGLDEAKIRDLGDRAAGDSPSQQQVAASELQKKILDKRHKVPYRS